MKIYTATEHFLPDVSELFREHGGATLIPQDWATNTPEIDILVFTGGGDINPARYGEVHQGYFSDHRDAVEFTLGKAIVNGKLNPKKIVGICRGLQLINILHGGTLVFDIHTEFGKSHNYVHPVKWEDNVPFSAYLNMLNSLHHQAIRYIGDNLPYGVLGVEPETGVIEAIQWANRWLAFQFHPELMGSDSIRSSIANTIAEWFEGKIALGAEHKKAVRNSYVNYGASFGRPVSISADTDEPTLTTTGIEETGANMWATAGVLINSTPTLSEEELDELASQLDSEEDSEESEE